MIDQHKSLAEKFVKKGFWLYLFSFIIAPIGYFIKIIISNELSVSDVGIIYGVISLITMISAYNDLWVTSSMQYFIPKYITEERYDKVKFILIYAFSIQIFTWAILWLFFFFWSDILWTYYFKSETASSVLKVFSFYFILINIFQIIGTFFLSIQNTLYNKIIEFIRMFFSLSSVCAILFLDIWNITYFSLAWLVWLCFWIIFAIYLFIKRYYNLYLQKQKAIFDSALFRSISAYAITSFIAVQSSTILSQIDIQMIIYLLWTQDAWYYTNYLTIISIPFIIIWPLLSLILPVISELNSKAERSKIMRLREVFFNNFLTIWILLNTLFFIYSDIIAYIFFWTKFLISWEILKYSILFFVFNYLLNINFNILYGIWEIKKSAKIIGTAILINFILNLFFIHLIGVYWAALATWIWWIIIWSMSEKALWDRFKIQINWHFILKNIISIIFIGYVLYNIRFIFVWLSRVESLIYFCGISGIYVISFVIINLNNLKDLYKQVRCIK